MHRVVNCERAGVEVDCGLIQPIDQLMHTFDASPFGPAGRHSPHEREQARLALAAHHALLSRLRAEFSVMREPIDQRLHRFDASPVRPCRRQFRNSARELDSDTPGRETPHATQSAACRA